MTAFGCDFDEIPMNYCSSNHWASDQQLLRGEPSSVSSYEICCSWKDGQGIQVISNKFKINDLNRKIVKYF